MTEVTALEFDTPWGAHWAAAKYLAVCTWPDNYRKRTALVRALLCVAGGEHLPWHEHRARVEKRIEAAAHRFARHGLVAAEIARMAALPPALMLGGLKLLLPSRHAVGRGGRVSIKQLHFLAGNEWAPGEDPRDAPLGNENIRKNTWTPFLPAIPYIIAIWSQFSEGEIPHLVDLVIDTTWVDSALVTAAFWIETLPHSAGIPADQFIRLERND